jgi:LAS superfamily LD-carboxypeptidase LdcB
MGIMNMTVKQRKIAGLISAVVVLVIAIIILVICINGTKRENNAGNDTSSIIGVNGGIETTPTTTELTQQADVPVTYTQVTRETTVERFEISTNEVNLEVGQQFMPIITVIPETAKDKTEIWISDNTKIAIVDAKGTITAISPGTCKVNVSSADNPAVNLTVTVNVTAKATTVATTTVTTKTTPKATVATTKPTEQITQPEVTETQPAEPETEATTTEQEEVTPTYINNILIVNKSYPLPKDYRPDNDELTPETSNAFEKMRVDAQAEGLNLYISSGFRSYEYQAQLYQRYADRDGYEKADTYSARAGYSEHQTGLAFDLNTIDDSFANTPEGKWVAENCWKYGFILRYPKGKEAQTGYQYEPWHLRYVGEDMAKKVYDSGLCLEEYLGITSQYKD